MIILLRKRVCLYEEQYQRNRIQFVYLLYNVSILRNSMFWHECTIYTIDVYLVGQNDVTTFPLALMGKRYNHSAPPLFM